MSSLLRPVDLLDSGHVVRSLKPVVRVLRPAFPQLGDWATRRLATIQKHKRAEFANPFDVVTL